MFIQFSVCVVLACTDFIFSSIDICLARKRRLVCADFSLVLYCAIGAKYCPCWICQCIWVRWRGYRPNDVLRWAHDYVFHREPKCMVGLGYPKCPDSVWCPLDWCVPKLIFVLRCVACVCRRPWWDQQWDWDALRMAPFPNLLHVSGNCFFFFCISVQIH